MPASMPAQYEERQPLFDPSDPAASLDRLGGLVMPLPSGTVQGSVFGDHESFRKGHGQERNGVRDYEFGDDPRYIDVALTARHPLRTPQIREHHRDVTPDLWVVTDIAKDENTANEGHYSKMELGFSAGVAAMLLAQRARMPVGMVASNEHQQIESGRTPLRGKRQNLRLGALMTELATDVKPSVPLSERVQLADLLKDTGSLASRGVVVVVSDFRSAAPDDAEHGWQNPLEELSAQHNRVVAIEVTSPDDFVLAPEIERFRAADKTRWVGSDRGGRAIREQYAQGAPKQQAAIDEALAGADAHHIKLSTADPAWFDTFAGQLRR